MTRTSPVVTLATIDLSFHHAAAGIVIAALARHGVRVDEIRRPHEGAFELLRDGTADMLCAAWLPGSHGAYFDAIADAFEPLSAMYAPYALWGVPDYVPADAVSSVADLTRADVVERMTPLIQGIGPGAGISRFSREIFAAYDLDAHGYRFANGTLEQCVDAFEEAAARRAWVVVPLWRPQYLHWRHAIRELREPRGLLRGADAATLVLRKSARERLPAAAVDALRQLRPGNAGLTRLDHLISRDGLSPREAGERYLRELAARVSGGAVSR
ncbi:MULTISPECIES: glycine betaine ABC transporter substrate-binding protein [Burkholderia]|uniref:Glycine/betaine ABC transporter substrate-binding protein n=1 Tax=Burkholderia savannae TaxID=1637837 RepID=A0ABR5T4I5_9BURK|nr:MULTISPECIES: glycine betaine ABC transporter substrate-binding protein [Burkholderia]AOJ71434.1 glycine/betaine ABC transporter substrate-binding protein [Burkholderia savannae]AOJ83942.1 glycine/betaine ABC transporter substrate-binding protein [Burkholderia savannae]KVG37175.1 glycine/betaine ABC transporter substrate-binding protein [Burkholderia sp. MSMB0265]KVG77800.1 glycine/betaine ABC transporter substrate-binding protein [Burkholderia sp. MSMB2040]KVG94234.1 glycine/betaine ABC tr